MRYWYLLGVLILSTCTVQPSWALQEHRQYAAGLEVTYKLPTGLLRGICEVENHWQHPSPTGAAGEIGLCQVKPDTARGLGMRSSAMGNLHQGMKSKAVATLQTELKKRGYDPGTIDGVFGLRTHIAVTLFQSAVKLKQDGVVGPRTWRALGVSGLTVAEQLKDPYVNMDYAARYLVQLRDQLKTNDPDILAAAYNGGPANRTVDYMLKVRRANE